MLIKLTLDRGGASISLTRVSDGEYGGLGLESGVGRDLEILGFLLSPFLVWEVQRGGQQVTLS